MAAKQKIGKLTEELDNLQKETKTAEDFASAILKARTKLITNYKDKSLVDIVASSVEISMEVIKGSIEESKKKKKKEEYTAKQFLQVQFEDEIFKKHYDYFIEYFNCCRFETFATVMSEDTRERVLALYTKPDINSLLRTYERESYTEATLHAARRLKDKLITFWNTYIENK